MLARAGVGLADWSSDSLAGRGAREQSTGGMEARVGLGKFAWTRAMLGRIDRLGQMDSSFRWGELTYEVMMCYAG
jgi:hypothetical protein